MRQQSLSRKACSKLKKGSVVACRKCGKRSRIRKLLDWLGERLALPRARLTDSGCLGICPEKGRVVVATAGPGHSWVVDPRTDRDQLLGELSRRLDV